MTVHPPSIVPNDRTSVASVAEKPFAVPVADTDGIGCHGGKAEMQSAAAAAGKSRNAGTKKP